ncbi:MAG: DNA polymerase IV [Nitrospirae bacterium]|nr:DNA polymerase IV [Nitrospirota bacterium]
MRTILLVDMDSFFASVEQQSNPALRGKPVAVIGSGKRTVITTASYEARSFGVKTGMNVWEAKKVCPKLIFVTGNNGKYTHTCRMLTEIYSKYTSEVEVYSIDEAFLDITGSLKLFGSPIEIGKMIKREIKERFGLNATIGMGPNKLMAKLASDISKPDGLKFIRQEEIPEAIERLPVDALWGIGGKIAEKLGALGIRTCGELGRAPVSLLKSRFGIIGERLKLMGMGIDTSPVMSNEETAKSVGHSMTLPRDIWREEEIEAYMLKLSEMAGRRARRYKLAGDTVTVTIRYKSFRTFTKQLKINRHINDTHEIHNTAMEIIRGIKLSDSVRLLGVSLSGLRETGMPAQLNLLSGHLKKENLLNTADGINDRHGDSTVSWAAYMPYTSRPAVISPAWRPAGVHRTNV